MNRLTSRWAFLRSFGLLVVLLIGASACTASRPPSASLPDKASILPGPTVTVKPNQNVYAIAKEHGVSMREVIVLNDLKAPYTLRAGQSLVLPAGAAGDLAPPMAAPAAVVERNYLPPITPSAVTAQPLDAPVVAASPAPVAAPAAAPSSLTPPPVEPSVRTQEPVAVDAVQSLNRPAPAPKQAATTAAAPAEASTMVAEADVAMRWPVQGPILSTFGSKGAGMNNDGINIGAPKGSPVVAAAPGTVVYSGDEMKGFGNLVLIRHQGDWITAYAHLDRVLVKKDSIVAQGDMIGTVGKTGNVASPQLHFETRRGGKPVDPSQVMKAAP